MSPSHFHPSTVNYGSGDSYVDVFGRYLDALLALKPEVGNTGEGPVDQDVE